MFEYFQNWYKKKFSDPHAVTLAVILLFLVLAIYFFSSILMPVIVAFVIAYLLEGPVARLKNIGLSRRASVIIVLTTFCGFALLTIFGLVPLIWSQGSKLVQELPMMFNKSNDFLLTLPEKYPDIVQLEQIQALIATFKVNLLEWGKMAIQASIGSISDIVALLVYLILVPLMAFFFMKDKHELIYSITQFLPSERRMAAQVGREMNVQIMNYLRGKVIEIVIVGVVSTITFLFLDLRYAELLGVLVGLSVLVPYVGATIVTFPVAVVGLFQWGVSPEFGYLMLAYAVIQALDGNLLVPLLFSEAVNLHPVAIIIAVILFGGLWGFWGVFFAIPLATLVKAIINAWTETSPALIENHT